MTISNSKVSELYCLACTCFFGVSWVGAKQAMNIGIGPLTYNALRFTGSALILYFGQSWLHQHIESDVTDGEAEPSRNFIKLQKIMGLEHALSTQKFELYLYGVYVGLSGFFGLCLQQVALVDISATKAGFITSLFVVVTPILEYFFRPCLGVGSSLTWRTVLAAFVSMVGMYFLTGLGESSKDLSQTDDGPTSSTLFGECVMFISMLCISIEIIICDVACKRVDCIDLTVIMFIIVAAMSVITALLFEPLQWFAIPPFSELTAASPESWVLVGLVSFTECAGYTAAALGQMYTSPSRAAVIFTMEGVTTALFAYLFLGEVLNRYEGFGCFLVFSSTVMMSVFTVEEEIQEQRRKESFVSIDLDEERRPTFYGVQGGQDLMEMQTVNESTPLNGNKI